MSDVNDLLGIKPIGEAIDKTVGAVIESASVFLDSVCKPAMIEFGFMLSDKVRYWRLNNISKMLMKGKHSIASVDISMKSNTFALQNIKQRIWQAVKILKGYWNFTTRSQRQVEYQLFLSVKRMVSFTLSLRGGTRTVIR